MPHPGDPRNPTRAGSLRDGSPTTSPQARWHHHFFPQHAGSVRLQLSPRTTDHTSLPTPPSPPLLDRTLPADASPLGTDISLFDLLRYLAISLYTRAIGGFGDFSSSHSAACMHCFLVMDGVVVSDRRAVGGDCCRVGGGWAGAVRFRVLVLWNF